MAEGFNKEDLENLYNNWSKIAELQAKAAKSLKDYGEIMKSINEVQRQLKYLMELEKRFARERDTLESKRLKLEKRLQNSKGKTKDLVKEELEAVQKEIVLREEEIGLLAKKKGQLQDNAKILEQSVNSSNLMAASFNTMGRGLKSMGSILYRQGKELLQQQKAVKQTELSMGVLSNQADAFRSNIYKASLNTNQLGVDTKQLAQMQGNYSEQVGRTLVLTEKGLEAMAELSSGTMLGAEGAAQLAAEMQNFGVSVVGTKEIVEEMLNTAHKMGVNAEKVTKNLQKNMKLAQKYHFKDGIKGLTRMAATAAKFKMEMSSIAGFADQLFTPEGAVEMAAQLQVLGGEWSKIADPFSLMFKARNDFEGLFNDVVHATKGMAQFNEETGQMEMSGLELHRLREIANATGIEFEQLSQASKEFNRQLEVRSRMTGFFSKEDQEYLETIAQFNEDTGQFEVKLGEEIIPIDEMHKFNKSQMKQMIKSQKNEEANLKKRAKQAQTFDETWKNIINTLKATLLPALEGFSRGLTPVLQDFNEWMADSGFAEKLGDFSEKAGKLAGSLITWIVKNPLETGILALIGSGVIWMARGRMLGMGFMQVAGGMGGGIPGSRGRGGGGMMATGRAGRGQRNYRRMRKMGIPRGGARGLSRIGKFATRGLGLGMLGGVASMGLDYGRENWLDDPDSTAGKAMGVGGTALEGAAYGAMIGSVVPVIGTALGGLLGGIGGAIKGTIDEFGSDSKSNIKIPNPRQMNDFISRPGAPPTPINSADTVVGYKKDGPIEKAVGGGTPKNVNVTFKDDLRIEGTITLQSGEGVGEIDLSDPVLMRDLSRMIQEELSRAIGGGKMSSNPA